MSVLIEGMALPSCCIDCPIYDNEFGQCNLFLIAVFIIKIQGKNSMIHLKNDIKIVH